ncbi:MAG: biotin synthase BioB [Syntrophales bacterium]|nr:biotin synthase BioB [Syntrophales bacterium]
MISANIAGIAEKILREGENVLSFDDVRALAHLPEENTIDLLYCAHRIRKHYKNELIICSIINAKSGLCTEDCAFCSQSSHHSTGIDIYPLLDKEEIVSRAHDMKKAGATRFSMVTSGVMLTDKELNTVCSAAETIARETKVTVCGSLGMLDESMAVRLRKGGLSVYHHNLETARSHFDRVCTTHSYDEDIQTVKSAGATGMRVCSGGILGLGENWEQRMELAFTLRELDVDGIPLNFLNPIPGTRMEAMPLLSPMEALRCIALFRLVNPSKDIIICGGREVTLRDYQSWIFFAGANGLMIGNYLTTQGRNIQMDIDMLKQSGTEYLS